RADVRRDGVPYVGQVVVGPAGYARNDEKLVNVPVGADEQQVLAAVGVQKAGKRRVHVGGSQRPRQCGQVVVDPAVGPGSGVELVDVVVGADEEDVLAAVAAPVADQ